MPKTAYLEPPHKESQQFKTNYLDHFVIELRFPALLEITQDEPIVIKIQKAVRTKYPHYEKSFSKQITPVGSSNDVIHEFRDKKRINLINLKHSSVSFSTSNYTSFAHAKEQCEYAIQNVVPYLQTNFFTRVGMRYINKLSIDNTVRNVNEWIIDELTGSNKVLGTLTGLKMEYAGNIDEKTTYLFRCGTADEPIGSKKPNTVLFVLDYDYSQQDVEVTSVLDLLDTIHEKHFSFFWWSLGEKAKEELLNA